MSRSEGKIIRYIQQSLYEGKEPNADGYYVFSRRELSNGAGVSLTAVDNNRDKVLSYFMSWCDLCTWAKFNEYPGEVMYISVKYENGRLMFRRNPITFQEEVKHLWAMAPLEPFFTYDYIDEKHRRRWNGNEIKCGAIPLKWNEEKIATALTDESLS